MPAVSTPEVSQPPRPGGGCNSAFPGERAGRLLHTSSISGLMIPFTCVPAYVLPVYASPGTLPYLTQDSVPDCWLHFIRAVISDGWTLCAYKAQPPPNRTCRFHGIRLSNSSDNRGPSCLPLWIRRWHFSHIGIALRRRAIMTFCHSALPIASASFRM